MPSGEVVGGWLTLDRAVAVFDRELELSRHPRFVGYRPPEDRQGSARSARPRRTAVQSAVILDPVTDSGTTSTEHEEVWLRPSPRLGIMRRVEVLGVAGLAAAVVMVLTAVGFVVGAAVNLTVAVALVVAIALAGLLGDRWAQRRVRAWAYCEREDDLVVRRGVMISRLSVIPYGRMQFIDVIAGPIERAFGLATVRMHTAAASSDARIPGLTQVEAARLRDRLAQLGESRAAGL
jgi:membrane protein YdbS with pleckstrin-like domain